MVRVVTELFQLEPFRRVIKSFCRRTAIGSDQVVFHWLVDLPDAALHDLGHIFILCFLNLAVPDTLLDHYLSAIPKKDPGTHRLIVVLASMLRLLLGMLTRTFVRPWDAEYSSPQWRSRPWTASRCYGGAETCPTRSRPAPWIAYCHCPLGPRGLLR